MRLGFQKSSCDSDASYVLPMDAHESPLAASYSAPHVASSVPGASVGAAGALLVVAEEVDDGEGTVNVGMALLLLAALVVDTGFVDVLVGFFVDEVDVFFVVVDVAFFVVDVDFFVLDVDAFFVVDVDFFVLLVDFLVVVEEVDFFVVLEEAGFVVELVGLLVVELTGLGVVDGARLTLLTELDVTLAAVDDENVESGTLVVITVLPLELIMGTGALVLALSAGVETGMPAWRCACAMSAFAMPSAWS